MAVTQRRLLVRAAGVTDAEGRGGAPGAVLLRRDPLEVIACGTPAAVGVPDGVEVVDLPGAVVLPGLVNAHCHLDLSGIGPEPFGGDFLAWIDGVRRRRPTGEAASRALSHGAALALAGGTAVVGDIAGNASRAGLFELAAAGLAGVSYLEVIGIGAGRGRALSALRAIADDPPAARGLLRPGASPHTPWTCADEVFAAARAIGLPLATHLAETPQEIEFVRCGTGPCAAFLERLGVPDAGASPSGRHPVEHVCGLLEGVPVLAAHCNYIEDRHLEMLARHPVAVAYCPRASDYFGHRNHRYRDMLDAGVAVALGTDGLPCLDTPDRITVLDEMRFLSRRDGTDPRVLLRMGTTTGAAALGFDPDAVTLAPGPVLGLIACACDPRGGGDPFADVLRRREPPAWVVRQ